jgi:CheY-like chemotaxis protein
VKPKVLIVDDDEMSQLFLQGILGDMFEFSQATSGEGALPLLAQSEPAVILLDVEMPGGIDGYQVCRKIKNNPSWQNIPVFFISAHSAAEDRLKAYRSGVEELRYKLTLALANQNKRKELTEKAHSASKMAMTSLREAASTGVVLGLLSEVVRLTDHEQIIGAALHALQRINMQGAVQLRAGADRTSRNSTGVCSAVEESVLSAMANNNRIVDLDNRSAFNYERATVIAYGMPLHDPELYGRLKDTIVKMAEALDVHMRALEGVQAAIARGDELLKQINQRGAIARDAQARAKAQRDDMLRALRQLGERVREAAGDGAQAELMQPVAREIQALALGVAHSSAALDTLLASLGTAVEDPQPAAPLAVLEADATRFNSVELF